MRKSHYLIASLLLSLLIVNCVQAADDFSEFDEFDEPEIKIDSPELNDPERTVKQQPPPEDHEFDEEPQEPADGHTGAPTGDEDEEVTVEEVPTEEDELPEKKEKEKKPFEPIKLSSLPLHLRFVDDIKLFSAMIPLG